MPRSLRGKAHDLCSHAPVCTLQGARIGGLAVQAAPAGIWGPLPAANEDLRSFRDQLATEPEVEDPEGWLDHYKKEHDDSSDMETPLFDEASWWAHGGLRSHSCQTAAAVTSRCAACNALRVLVPSGQRRGSLAAGGMPSRCRGITCAAWSSARVTSAPCRAHSGHLLHSRFPRPSLLRHPLRWFRMLSCLATQGWMTKCWAVLGSAL